ncbi:uncharacterized protein LOC135117974 [Helicoverpa armigera]|uniref:uncharacterized protein LOC135117974 n=1 Tax=Helicoverpa armigera TaxID=29058 RepID=UPI003083EB7F
MCHSTSQWTEALPLVLLGMRTSWKDDIQTTPAELVYGEPLHLPGQFISPTEQFTAADVTQYATRLRVHMANLTPRPTSWHTTSPFYIPRDLYSASHVFLRRDDVRKPLEPPYTGPHKVLQRQPKYFTLDVKGKNTNVSVDRLKPAFVLREEVNEPRVHNGAEAPTSDVVTTSETTREERATKRGRRVRFPDFYRP